MTPKLKLKIDIDADIKNCVRFLGNGDFVGWFLPKDFQYILSKKFSTPERNKIIREYTRHVYKINHDTVERRVADTEKRWKKIESKFFEIADRIFSGHPWPRGRYEGIASIYLMYPRDIKTKTFFFPSIDPRFDSTGVIAHEMLHFIFFDYIEKRYHLAEGSEPAGKGTDYVWRVSETFNNVIEDWRPFRAVFGGKNGKPYPGCEKMFMTMKRQWKKEPAVGSFLDKWLPLNQ